MTAKDKNAVRIRALSSARNSLISVIRVISGKFLCFD
jgi:hypothetical protein